MTKRGGNRKGQNRKERWEWPFIVYVWTIGLGVVGYLIVGEFALAGRPHPYHWASGLVGVAAGVVVGWLWYRWRGDVVPGSRR